MTVCPTCGQEIPTPKPRLDADALWDVLSNGTPHRQVYKGTDGGWWVTYGGGETTFDAVQTLIRERQIQSVYSDCPHDSYHIGKTLDTKATTAERQKHRRAKDAPLIYTDGSREVR